MRPSILLPSIVLAACAAGPVDLGQTAWQGTLSGGPGKIAGSVAALVTSGRTHASIALRGAVSGQQYGWRISQGDCLSEGASFGAAAVYPALVAGADGTATADAFLSQALGSGPYAARVLLTQAAGETVAGCAALTRVN